MAVDQLKQPACAAGCHPVSYFRITQDAFASAAHACTRIDRFYQIAGYNVCLSFAGDALVPYICPALEHLSSEPTAFPDLTVSLWDSVSTRTEMPPPPWNPSDYGIRGEIAGYNDDRISTCFRHGSGVVSLMDNALNQAVAWVPDASQLPYWEQGAPLLNILHWWMSQRERLLVHGAAVGTAEGAALIVGRSGSGKSTTALACLSSGLLYLGDDYTIIAMHPSPSVHSLYNTAKVDGNHIKMFPHLLPGISNSAKLGREKALIFLNSTYKEQIVSDLKVRAILVPRVTGESRTQLKKISAAAALAALAPSTVFQLPRAGAPTFNFVAEFVKKLPCYMLECGRDLGQIPKAVVGALSGDAA